MKFTVHFISYTGLYRTIETDKLNVPTKDGRRTLLSNHMPIMLSLDVGVVETSLDGKLEHYAISDGMMMFDNNEATLLCDTVIDVKDIDVERAQKSLEKANDKSKRASSEAEVIRAKIALARAANLISASSKYKN